MSNPKYLKPQPHHTPAKTFVLTEEDFAEAAKDYRKAALSFASNGEPVEEVDCGYAQSLLHEANKYGYQSEPLSVEVDWDLA